MFKEHHQSGLLVPEEYSVVYEKWSREDVLKIKRMGEVAQAHDIDVALKCKVCGEWVDLYMNHTGAEPRLTMVCKCKHRSQV